MEPLGALSEKMRKTLTTLVRDRVGLVSGLGSIQRSFGLHHLVASVGFAILAAGCAAGTGADAPPVSQAAVTEPYVIGPGDHLGVFVYDNPQLSVTDLPVQPDGLISLPLIQDLPASGKTPSELSAEVASSLKKYVKEPNVTVMVHDFVGPVDRQIRVIGEAADPQAIAYREHMTLLDVMIQTRGLTRFAAGNRAVIIRRVGPGKRISFRVHLANLIKDGDVSENVDMQPGDTLIIPQAWF